MEIIKVTLPVDHEIVWMACCHEGNGHQHRKGLAEAVDYITQKDNRYAVIVGDLVEGIHITDRRYEKDVHDKGGTILRQFNNITGIFEGARGRIITALSGNHEWTVRHYGDGVKEIFCERLKVPYGTYSCKIHVQDQKGRLQYKVFVTHGNGHISSVHPDPVMREASLKSQVKRKLAKELMADCHLNIIAHFHRPVIVHPYQSLYLVDDGEKIRQKYLAEVNPRAAFIPEEQRWYAAVPGFLKKYGVPGVSGYVERSGLAPVELGFLVSHANSGRTFGIEKRLV
jgi:hypothetical protein